MKLARALRDAGAPYPDDAGAWPALAVPRPGFCGPFPENPFCARALERHLQRAGYAPCTREKEMKIRTRPLLLAAILAGSFSLTGCLAAAVGAGYVAGEEISEDDGDFDPLDEVVDGE